MPEQTPSENNGSGAPGDAAGQTVELFVKLVIPDTTAITALNTLKKMGFPLSRLSREDYYQFVLRRDADAEEFSQKIKKVDILANANKHAARTVIEHDFKASDSRYSKESEKGSDGGLGSDFGILVTNSDDDCAGLLKTLRERLGFGEILLMRRGTYWRFETAAGTGEEKEKLAHDIARALLYNPHYQDYILY